MVTEVRWSNNAILDYNDIVLYLSNNWGIVIAERFIEITENKVNKLTSHPYIGLLSNKVYGVRSILLTEHNRLYYRILSKEVIEIVNIFDTRQDPAKNKY